MSNLHPIDQLRISYAQSVTLPLSPENALRAEATLRRIREDATIEEKVDAWRRIQRARVMR